MNDNLASPYQPKDIELSVKIEAIGNKSVADARILIKKPHAALGFKEAQESWEEECTPTEMFCKMQPLIRGMLLEQMQNTPTPCLP